MGRKILRLFLASTKADEFVIPFTPRKATSHTSSGAVYFYFYFSRAVILFYEVVFTVDKMEQTPSDKMEVITPAGAPPSSDNKNTTASSQAENMQVDDKTKPTPPPVPAPVVKNASLSPLEYAKDTIQTWQSFNRHVNLKLGAVQETEFLMNFTVGPTNAAFQVLFTDQWRPMVGVF